MTVVQSPLSRAQIVAAAKGWIGTPYRHQASLKGAGCDCLGLVRGVWRELIGPEPEAPGAYSPDWAETGGHERLAEAGIRHFVPVSIGIAAPGDVLLFRWRSHVPAKHVGILTAPDAMVHAQDGARVCEAPLSNWWRRRIAYVFSFPGLND